MKVGVRESEECFQELGKRTEIFCSSGGGVA